MLQFEACCGYTAAAIACLAFGSFAVPIKSPSVQRENVDPLGTYDVRSSTALGQRKNQNPSLETQTQLLCVAGSSTVVLQTYKIVLNFAVSMILVTAFLHEPIRFSPWGIVSGLFMVPGGTAGYYAVQTSGLAIRYVVLINPSVIHATTASFLLR